MSGPLEDHLRAQYARVTGPHVAGLIEAIAGYRRADALAKTEGQSETAEYLAMQALNETESTLLAAVLHPLVERFLQGCVDALNDIGEPVQ